MVLPLVGGILKAAVPSLIGGLFGSKQKAQTSQVNYVQMRDNALEAGFNPLTALRNGGAAGFTSVTPALSSGAFIKSALQDGFAAFDAHKRQEVDAEREALELETMRENLKGMKQQQRIYEQGNLGFAPPRVNQYTGRHQEKAVQRNDKIQTPKFVPSAGYPYGRPDQSAELRGAPPPTKTENLYIDVFDQQTGRTSRILNPDLMDMGPTEILASSSMIATADAAQNGVPKLAPLWARQKPQSRTGKSKTKKLSGRNKGRNPRKK